MTVLYTLAMHRMVLASVICTLGGCATNSARVTDNPVPSDFSLEVREPAGPDRSGALFIVEPDRVFRAATGPTPDGNWYPPATRRLTPDQVSAVWLAIEALAGVETGSNEAAGVPMPPLVFVSSWYDGGRWMWAADPASNSQLDTLLKTLRRYAWID